MKKNDAFLLVLMFVFALSRWPGLMPANFSALYAIVFCSGLYFTGWKSWVVPTLTLVVTDILLNTFYYHTGFSWKGLAWMLFNYVAYAGIYFLGKGLANGKRSLITLIGGGVVGAFIFYIVTNIISWLTLPYPKTLAGLIQALTVGLPNLPHTWEFFRNTLLGGGFFTGLLVGAVKLCEPAESAEEKREPVPEAEPEPEEAKS